MADTVASKPPVVIQLPSVEQLKKHLDEQEKAAMVFAGSPNFNPSLWVARTVRPLRDALKVVGAVNKELVDKVFAVSVPKQK